MVQPFFLFFGLHPYDHQRFVEIIFLASAFLFFFPFVSVVRAPKEFLVIVLISIFSVFYGRAGLVGWVQEMRFFFWAFFLGVFPFYWSFLSVALKKMVSALVFLGLVFYAFYVVFGAFFLLAKGVSDSAFIISGFANINHAAAFMVLGIFILPGVEFLLSDYRRVVVPVGLIVGGCLFFLVSIVMARGSFVAGLIALIFVMVFFKGAVKVRYCLRLFHYVVLGLTWYFFFYFDFNVLDIGSSHVAEIYRDTGRVALFKEGVAGWLDSPFLGNGPLSFSLLASVPEAHPHNLLIVSLYEYGVIFSMMAFVLLVKVGLICLKGTQRADQTIMSVAGWATIVCFLSYAQVSGLTMIAPSMLLLALATGFAFERNILMEAGSYFMAGFSWVRGIGALVLVAVFFGLSIWYYQAASENISGAPRFWLQGKL